MLRDQHGRRVNYLRLSVTERCNFRCLYCMPDKPLSWVPKENILSYEELFLFIKAAIDEGVDKIRITGGEPTLRAGLEGFIKMITDYAPGIDLALTSNGFLMAGLAEKYAEAGLKRINISLDSLKRDVAGRIANRDVLNDLLAGIEASRAAGLKVKLNMVPMRGINDGEIVDILNWAMVRNIPLRYIEYMENSHANKHVKGMRSAAILETIAKAHDFRAVESGDTSSPATLYELKSGYRFGVIEPHLERFCENCNRIRLTAEGFLIPCLYFDEALSIREKVQAGDVPGAVAVLKTVLANKPEKNRWGGESESSDRAFYMTGG